MACKDLLLLGPRGDPHLAALAVAATERDIQVHAVDSRARPAGPRVSFSPAGAWTIDGVNLEEVTGAFVRAVPPRHPSFAFDDGPFSPEDARTAESEGGSLRDAVCAALERLWALGRPVLNPPVAGVYEQQKPWQLSIARRAGLAVPATVVTNVPDEARRFIAALADDGRECIAKPVRGPGFARLVEPGDERVERVARGPVVLQERVLGRNVRALLLDDALLGAAHITGIETVDYREDARYRAGEAGYETVSLDDETVRQCVSVQRGAGASFSGVDLIVPDDGPPVFLELNAAPAWLEMEERLGLAVTASLAARLEGDT